MVLYPFILLVHFTLTGVGHLSARARPRLPATFLTTRADMRAPHLGGLSQVDL